jgi:hypothetical protein
MYSVAGLFDGLGIVLGLFDLIPFVGIIFSIIANALLTGIGTGTFWFWFKLTVGHKGRGKALGKQPLYRTLVGVIELILGFLPGWSFFVFMSIRDVKKEDAMYNKKMSKEQQAQHWRTHRAANDNQPRYQRGYRAAA